MIIKISDDELGMGVLVSVGIGVVLLVRTGILLVCLGVLVIVFDFEVTAGVLLVVGEGVVDVVCVGVVLVRVGVVLLVGTKVALVVGIGVDVVVLTCVVLVGCIKFVLVVGTGVVLVVDISVVLVVITGVVLVVITGVVVVVTDVVMLQIAIKPGRVSLKSVSNTTCMYPVFEVNTAPGCPRPDKSTIFSTVEQEDVVHRLIVTKSLSDSVWKNENVRPMKPFEAMIQEQYILFSYCDAFTDIIPDLVPVDGWQRRLQVHVTFPTALLVGAGVVLVVITRVVLVVIVGVVVIEFASTHFRPSVLVCPRGHCEHVAGPTLVLLYPTGHDAQPEGRIDTPISAQKREHAQQDEHAA